MNKIPSDVFIEMMEYNNFVPHEVWEVMERVGYEDRIPVMRYGFLKEYTPACYWQMDDYWLAEFIKVLTLKELRYWASYALGYVTRMNKPELVEVVIKKGMDNEDLVVRGYEPLKDACSRGFVEVIKLLLPIAKPSDFKLVYWQCLGRTPLDKRDEVKMLFKKKRDTYM